MADIQNHATSTAPSVFTAEQDRKWETVWPAGWRNHCPHQPACGKPTACPPAWAWVKATVLAEPAK